MPLGQSQDILQADPGGRVSPRFRHRLIRFRRCCSGSLALASLNLTCRNLVPTFPQRSPPLLLTTAACGGLKSAPDCRPRRTSLHLSYSYAAPFGPAILVTQVQAVFETIVRKAVSLCGSLFANVFRFDGELLHWAASYNVDPGYVGFLKATYPMRPDMSQVSGRVILGKSVVRLEDVLADPDYDQRFPQFRGWLRRMLGVPLLC